MEIRRSDEIRNLKEELKKRQQRRTASNPYSKKEENKKLNSNGSRKEI